MKIVPIGLFAASLLAAPLLAASAAHAAPTCLDREGATVRCGTPGAMPVGWALPSGEQTTTPSDTPSARGMIGLTLFLGGLFALIALLPDFEGRWDGQETDEEERG
jgi:hypothetical protein